MYFRLIRSTGGLSEVPPTFIKSNHDNAGHCNTTSSLINVVTIPSTCMTNLSTSVIVTSQSTTISSPMTSRSSRSNTCSECPCKESISHRPHHYMSGAHFSQNSHHYHHVAHRENYTSHGVPTSITNSFTNGGGGSGGGGSGGGNSSHGNGSNHQYSSSQFTSHYHHHNAPSSQQNMKHVSHCSKMKPGMSKNLQDFMISQWEQFRERLLNSNADNGKSYCTEAVTATTMSTTNTTSKFTFGDVNNNNTHNTSSSDIIPSRTTISSSISSHGVTTSVVEFSVNRRANDSTVIANSETSYGAVNNNNGCGAGSSNSCSGYLRRKQNSGYGNNQMGKSMNSGSVSWKRGQIAVRKNSSPGNFSNRGPGNYVSNRNSIPTVFASISPPLVTCILSPTTTLSSVSESINTMAGMNQNDRKIVSAVDTKMPSASVQSSPIVVSVKPTTSESCCLLERDSPIIRPTVNSVTYVSDFTPTVIISTKAVKLKENSKTADRVSDMIINSESVEKLAVLNVLSTNDRITDDQCIAPSLQIKDTDVDLLTDEKLPSYQITSERLLSTVSLLTEVENLAKSASQDDETGRSINGAKVEEGECFWTPDPPASPENSTALQHGNYSSSYHSTNLSTSPQLSVSLPNSEDLQTTVYHPPLEIQSERTSLPDIYRCNKLTDSVMICSSSSRLESLNDVD
ncbi:unnamed protein product [Heterobilharzia americana]|nr:unnamed protein product [Heterobilharzia americana]CAH8619125.1 unnamed protein product [Heterobilharzia americana]